jgi:CBS domain-containing protein
MNIRRIRNVMTRDVVTVTDTTPFAELVRKMAEHGVSALPVLDQDERLVGIVSEADLLRKEEYQDERNGRYLLEGRGRRAARAKAAGRTAADLMTSPVVTIDSDATIPEAARLLARHRIKRLPVVDDDGRLVGIASRSDLLRLFVRDDEEIRQEVVEEVFHRPMLVAPNSILVTVQDGITNLTGYLETRSLALMAVHLTRAVPGVVDVVDQLTYERDDTRSERVDQYVLGP